MFDATITPPDADSKTSVFGKVRAVEQASIALPKALKINQRLKMDGLKLLGKLPDSSIVAMFFDPQYRGVLDKLSYGNEGKNREKRRAALQQMDENTIKQFITTMNAKLVSSGHLFLWIDKFHLLNGFSDWLKASDLEIVDMITWNKDKMGMGYRSRRVSEYCVIAQKKPTRAKGCWTVHNIRDSWTEKSDTKTHPHAKPIGLQAALIEATSNEGDIIVDPAAGDFTVMQAAHAKGRNFLGCDLALPNLPTLPAP